MTHHSVSENGVIFNYFIAVQNKTLSDKNLSKQVDVWKICYVEKNKPSPTFLIVLNEMWLGAKFWRSEQAFSPLPRGEIQRGSEIMKGLLMAFFAI